MISPSKAHFVVIELSVHPILLFQEGVLSVIFIARYDNWTFTISDKEEYNF